MHLHNSWNSPTPKALGRQSVSVYLTRMDKDTNMNPYTKKRQENSKQIVMQTWWGTQQRLYIFMGVFVIYTIIVLINHKNT